MWPNVEVRLVSDVPERKPGSITLNSVIMVLAMAGGTYWATHIDASLGKLESTVQDRNDRLIRVEDSLQRIDGYLQNHNEMDRELRTSLEDLKGRMLLMEHQLKIGARK